ncbi:MAG: glycogen/starch synthase [Tannerella sp.]|jgi:glycosyltransferase involved in cell wall biosynthesis|nr:glycogen/starch synthase [Tannerella sp.]
MTIPDFLFECSWEVCNKIGGIHTVLSTKAHTLHRQFNDRAIYMGPDSGRPNPEFEEMHTFYPDWVEFAEKNEPFRIKTGRWQIPGTPPVILIDYQQLFCERNALYFSMWESFGVDSSRAYGDYDESCIFAYAAGRVIQSFYTFHRLEEKKVIAHFHEWMLGFGALYIQKHCPRIATVFTTHATSTGRSIAGNNKPLYQYLNHYNGDGMAHELNIEAKHSLEKQTARFADCFTTVSDITALECEQLLDKSPDVVTPNGFEPGFVPDNDSYVAKRNQARTLLFNVAEKLTGSHIDPNAFLVATSGRYEYRNKGIDVFIDVMNQLRLSNELPCEVVAFILVPAWVYAPRADLKEVLVRNFQTDESMQMPFLTHWLHEMDNDRVMNHILKAGFSNHPSEKLKIIFVPCYLDGNDGIFNMPYYDLLIGIDATLFPSYYEPWGYTPLESIAFGIPAITTGFAGFGLWVQNMLNGSSIDEGVEVVNRTDDNYAEVVSAICETLLKLIKNDQSERETINQKCFELASKAEWQSFIKHYHTAYDMALMKAVKRKK